MSDQSQGPGWWVASDGKWYAPELHPDAVAAPAPPPPRPAPPTGPSTTGAAYSAPSGSPPPGGAFAGPTPAPTASGRRVWPWLLAVGIIAIIGVVAASIAISGDDTASGGGDTTGSFCRDLDTHHQQLSDAAIGFTVRSDGSRVASGRAPDDQREAAANIAEQLRDEAPASLKDDLNDLADALRGKETMLGAAGTLGSIDGRTAFAC